MSIGEISRKIELHFWDWAIPALSASRFTRVAVKRFYSLSRSLKTARYLLLIFSVSAAGLLSGAATYLALAR
jgi:hypothetical protein